MSIAGIYRTWSKYQDNEMDMIITLINQAAESNKDILVLSDMNENRNTSES